MATESAHILLSSVDGKYNQQIKCSDMEPQYGPSRFDPFKAKELRNECYSNCAWYTIKDWIDRSKLESLQYRIELFII